MNRKRQLEQSNNISEEGVDIKDRSHRIRDDIKPKALDPQCSYMRIISWNVNGLRKLSTANKSILESLVLKHQPDILFLQETKIQESIINEYKDLLPDYTSFWNCSTIKKGYSGTAIFLKNQTIKSSKSLQSLHCNSSKSIPPSKDSVLYTLWKKGIPLPIASDDELSDTDVSDQQTDNITTLANVMNVSYDFEDSGKKCFAGEGRTITVELDSFFLVACYVPNSGEGLVRLQYRVKEWEPHMRQYLKQLSARKPVVYTGDLNCGHLDLDIHNPTAKHIAKQAGLTAEERAAFSTMLAETDFRDAFRHFHPDAKGQFTYWSVRAFNRPGNKGIRLDYFICSPDLFPDEGSSSKESHLRVHDTYILPTDTVGCSDHCPVALVLVY